MVINRYHKYCWKKASINASAKKYYIPLIIASQEGHSRSVKTLIKNGIDPFKTSGHGATAIYHAEQHGLIDCRNNHRKWISFK